MSSYHLVQEMDARLMEFNRQAMSLLVSIKNLFEHSGRPLDDDFRTRFIKVATDSLTATYSTFEMLGASGIGQTQGPTRMPMTSADQNDLENSQPVPTEANGKPFGKYGMIKEEFSANSKVASGNIVAAQAQTLDNVIEINDSSDEDTINNDKIGVTVVKVRRISERLVDGPITKKIGQNQSQVKHVGPSWGNTSTIQIDHVREVNSSTDEAISGSSRKNPSPINSQNVRLVAKVTESCSSNTNKTSKQSSLKKVAQCNVCGYRSKYKSNLKKHMRVHTGERPYSCDHCEYSFTTKLDLRRHITTHKERFPFHCIGCSRVFLQENDKLSHEKVCEYRRYECYLCKEYVTWSKSKMENHMRTHSGDRPFQCKICMKRFVQKGYLKIHLNNVHT